MDIKVLKKYSKKFKKNNKNILSRNAVSSNNIKNLVINRNVLKSINLTFHKQLFSNIKNISSQKRSGRCWYFAFLNTLKYDFIKRHNLENNFEFSHNYLLFYDSLEKSRFFLYNIAKTRNKHISDRLVAQLLQYPVSDGGQWNMIVNLINKYGLIPKNNMKETYQSNNTGSFKNLLNLQLKYYANIIRNRKCNTQIINNMMYQIYKLLVIALGEPPNRIDWKYNIKSLKKKNKIKNLNSNFDKWNDIDMDNTSKTKNINLNINDTSIDNLNENNNITKRNIVYDLKPTIFFMEYVKCDINNKISLINFPSKIKPYYRKYNVKYFNNIINGVNTEYFNVPIFEMKNAIIKSIDNNEPVWFGADVSKNSSSKYGLLHDKLLDYSTITDTEYELNKSDALLYTQNDINHAMIFKGYDLNKKGNISQLLVENSWGIESGLKGQLIMNEGWFNKYVYQIVIDKKYVSNKIIKSLGRKPIVCDIWDPFGNLAIY